MDSQSISDRFPGFSRVYRVADPCVDRAFRASLNLPAAEALKLLRGEARQLPVQGRWAMGSSDPGDIVWTTLAFPVVVSERVVSVLRENAFTGWNAVPIDLLDKKGRLRTPHYYLSVKGRCGPIDNGRSVQFDKLMPGGAFKWWRGLYFDAATWDGSDIFMPADDTAWIFVTEAVRLAIEKAKVRNVLLTPLDEIERMKL